MPFCRCIVFEGSEHDAVRFTAANYFWRRLNDTLRRYVTFDNRPYADVMIQTQRGMG